MKLNLWLIANQLTDYDIETKIAATTERNISGPLPVAAIGSVYVRDDGSNVICTSEQGTIIIHDMAEKEGFLLIQSIFNWYDTWLDNIENALRTSNYRMFVHLCAQAFSNPVLLQDSNSLLLGMDCRGIPIGSIPEWRHIYETEQSSVTYYLAMADALRNPVRKYSDCVCRFHTSAKDETGRPYQTAGLHASFRYLAHDFGQLTVLDKRRPLNPGDVALLNLLADRSSLLFAVAERGEGSTVNMRVLNDLLEGKYVPAEQVAYHYSVITRKTADKASRLCLFVFRSDAAGERESLIPLLKTLLNRQYPALYSWVYHNDLLVMVYVPEPDVLAQQMRSFLDSQGYAHKLHIGISLPFADIQDLQYHYEQAVFAMSTAGTAALYFFYDCACAYLLENTDMHRKIRACEPSCRKLWMEEPDKREFLKTLIVYLGMERATGLAADRLYIHRNTINYRIKYIRECTGWDYEDPMLRDYLRLSIYYLSRYDEK